MCGRYFDDFKVGEKFTTFSRTITEADLADALGLARICSPLFMDEEYAKKTIYGGRIVPGLLTVAVTIGLFERMGLLDGTLIALLGVNYKFTKAVKPGDTIHVEEEVVGKRETRRPERGIVIFKDTVVNQRGETVMEGERPVMVARRA